MVRSMLVMALGLALLSGCGQRPADADMEARVARLEQQVATLVSNRAVRVGGMHREAAVRRPLTEEQIKARRRLQEEYMRRRVQPKVEKEEGK